MKKLIKEGSFGVKLSLLFIALWLFAALCSPFIANESEGSIIPYSATTLDLNNISKSPFAEQNVSSKHDRHWLGTDKIGRDVLSNLLHGSRTAFLVGFGAVFIAAFIGILLGGISAYYEDNGLKITFLELIFYGLLKLNVLILLIILPWSFLSFAECIFLVFLLILWIGIAVYLIKKLKTSIEKRKKLKSIHYPVDLIVGRIIEILDAVPLLLILIVLSAIVEPSVFSTTLIIGVTAWAGIARFSRAELLKVKRFTYVEGGAALGLSKARIVFLHMLPNALPSILITLAFGVSASILIESTLSFLGLGISTDTASWGKLLAESRADYRAWWLAIFPGLTIFAAILSCNLIGEELSKSKSR